MDSLFIEFEDDQYLRNFSSDFAENIATLTRSYISSREGEVSISFVSQERIRELNRDYRSKDESTDILSFVQEEDSEDFFFSSKDEPILGDLVISLTDMFQNCEYFKVSKENELIRLIVHGFLHLNGHDHQTNSDDEPMLTLQEEIVKYIEKELGK